MKNVHADVKQTVALENGLSVAGEKVVLSEKHAKHLAEKGILEITGEADEEVDKPETSFTITDNSGKPKEKAEAETDPNDPTGKEKADKVAVDKKNAKAGPNSKPHKTK